MRELVVLGTASQVPTRTRNHNGYLLLWDGQGILFDPGEGTQRQMLHAGVSPSHVTRICLTHLHGDHCFGLPGVLSRMDLDGVAHPITCTTRRPRRGRTPAHRGDEPFLDLRLHPHGSAGEVADGLFVRPLLHRIETYGYQLVEPDGRTMLPERLAEAGIEGEDVGQLIHTGHFRGVRIEDVSERRPGQRFAFVMDTMPCPGAEELADGADLLVTECTFSDDEAELATAYRHLTAGQAGRIAAAGGAHTLVLTHFSSRYQDVEPLRRQAEAQAGETHVIAASDLDRYDLPPRRSL